MNLPVLDHVKNSVGSDSEVYIGRAGHGYSGYFGNPIKRFTTCIVCKKVHEKTSEVIKCFDSYARDRIKTDATYKEAVKGLLGKRLLCFCYPKSCHGSVLIKLCKELNTKCRLF